MAYDGVIGQIEQATGAYLGDPECLGSSLSPKNATGQLNNQPLVIRVSTPREDVAKAHFPLITGS